MEKALTLIQEMTRYKSLINSNREMDFSDFWNSYSHMLPLLTDFVLKYSIMSATSVPSESNFSIGGKFPPILQKHGG